MRYFIKSKKIQKCFDLEYDILLANCEFLASQLHKIIKHIIIFLKIRNISNRKHNTSKYCKLNFYIIEVYNKALVIIYFR